MMNKTTRLIKWQRITICSLMAALLTGTTYSRIHRREIGLREAGTLRNTEAQLTREKRYRAMEREQHDSEVNGWRKSAIQSLDALMESQETIDKQRKVLEKYRAKYGIIDPVQMSADICTGV